MKKDKISAAVSMIDDDLISEADIKHIHKTNVVKYVSVAACFVLACIITFSCIGIDKDNNSLKAPSVGCESLPSCSVSLLPSPSEPITSEGSVSLPSNGNHYQNANGAILQVLQQDEHSIAFIVTGSSFDYDISLNIISDSGKQYVYSTDSSKNTFTDGTVIIHFENFENGVYVKINYGEHLPKGYTAGGYIEIDSFGKIPLYE